MDTNDHELLLKEEAFEIVGCAMEVLNEPGHGSAQLRPPGGLFLGNGGRGCLPRRMTGCRAAA